ncbi:FAD-binding oxidoreductase [Fodinicola feengrottensis]|uniref:FAD-binding oxidoreductase n=1 Tax=Fodinicola feengrottensis TaxID=435914 RepID=A0ABP4SH99_9ACTN
MLDLMVFSPDSPGYDTIRRTVNPAYQHVRPRLVAMCRSVQDVVNAIAYAAATGDRIAVRSGGHCFAGRSSTDGIVLDVSGIADISMANDQVATIGAGARLGQVYAALHAYGRTLPAGCGQTVGIAGLTLGGGIGLLGRKYGLTCDRLVGAQVVLADGSVVECDHHREPDLFWGLRGAGGGQFGVVTALRFDTAPSPLTTRIQARWSGIAVDKLVAAWQTWAPDAPDDITVNLTVESEPGVPVHATIFGAATLDEQSTRELLREFTDLAGAPSSLALRTGLPYPLLKNSFADPREIPERVVQRKSEFFSHSMSGNTLAALLAPLDDAPSAGRRQLAFTAMGGAYNRIAEDATAFAHRSERFLLEHLGEAADSWVDHSWTTAHTDGSGRVYPNFPDLSLENWAEAYHAGNYARLAAIKNIYDPQRFFDFPQAI